MTTGRFSLGQARIRGPKALRVTQALQQQHTQAPPRLNCNQCQAELTNVAAVDARALQGIEAAFSAHCLACGHDTWAVRGQAAAVKAFYDALEKLSGQRIALGTAPSGG